MKLISLISLVILFSCAHQQRQPASESTELKAQDSIALGNVRATATKEIEKQGICFDIKLELKNVPRQSAEANNWTVAWIDHNDRYHLLDWARREPAAAPQGGQVVMPYGHYNEWTNHFKICAPQVNPDQVKALTLTPKTLPYRDEKGLTLSWQ
jgi:hypothetical protein